MSADVKMASTKSKEIADKYISSLSDLTINSKRLINKLTMLAENNIEHASIIVQAVETHLQKVRSDIKLPVLYLIDSIVKKVNGDYLNLFTQNIVNTFCGVFEKVDESTRASMWKLRQTWNNVFPPKKLFSLDVRVRCIDPAWPITALSNGISSGSIHVNPRFHSMPQQAATSIVQPVAPPVKLPPGDPVTTTEAVMREQLLKKQRELLELQKKKIGLELLQVKASLEQQQRQLDKQAGSLKTRMVAPTSQALPTKEQTVQGKPATHVMPNQVTKQVTKQFPAAAASLLKNARTNSGPRITPASSIVVASAKPVSRDPRLKSNKRTSTEHVETTAVKKLKTEKFDALFLNEDVDLRALTHPKAGRPPIPPPPVISGEDGKDSWAKLKTPTKNERDKQVNNIDGKRERDRNRDRLGRLRFYNKLSNDPKERRKTLSNEEPYGGPQGHFNSDMRHVAPWQNPRHFGPMRPDYQYHGGFNHNMGPNPRLGPGMMGPMGLNGPIMSNILPNGPMGPMGMPNPPMSIGCHPAMMMNNGPMTNLMANPNMPPLSSGRNLSPNTVSKYDLDDNDQNYGNTIMRNQGPHNRELPSSVLSSAMAPSSGLSCQAEPAEDPSASAAPLSMSELFQRLVETGLIVPNLTEQKKPEEEEKKEPEIISISFDKPESLKTKQPAIVTALYSGMQCSSCGVRFAPELATRYSQHLDWHFRQNRRERDSARKVHSRPWYYNVRDWMQFEEIEDLEDRPQSWFETEKQTAETEGVANDDLPQETLQPSVATGSDEDSRCQVCHDAFEQFYNEKKEEWHLRPAINYEEKNYHPLCLEDYKRVLERSTSTLEETIPEVGESKRECSEETFGEESKQKESDVEMSNKELESTENTDRVEESFLETVKLKSKEEPCKTGSPEVTQNNTEEKEKLEEETANEKSIDIESTERVSEESTMNEEEKSEAETMSAPFENIKIKEEPMDEIDEQTESELFEFANVAVKEEPMDPDTDPDGTIVNGPAMVDTTYVAMKSSIDGNVELESIPSRIPAAPPRIKINITKPLSANKESEENKEKEKVATVETPVEETMKPLVAASIKPSLRGRKLSTLPPVQKGHELSGLCSIM